MTVHWRSAAFVLALGALGAAEVPAQGDSGAGEKEVKLPPGITVLKDPDGSGTRFRPRFAWWRETEIRVYPFIIAHTDGGRQIVLHISRVARSHLGINTISFFVDGEQSRFEFKKAAVDRSGCLPDEPGGPSSRWRCSARRASGGIGHSGIR